MLRELHITGLGVIDDLDLELDPGLNVLTGETGAGKTMVTVGLALALGRRATASLVRTGATAARVQARFDATAAAVRDGWAEDGELLLARQVSADGRSAARIGGQLAPVSALVELGGGLVEMHGQHQGLRLLSAAAQTGFLDRFLGADHLTRVGSFGEAHGRLSEQRTRLEDLSRSERERDRELDLLAYQIREIESAAPRIGERASLETEAVRLSHVERLLERAADAERALDGEEAGLDALRRVVGALDGAVDLDPIVGGLRERATELVAAAIDLSHDLRAYREGLQIDPSRLEEVRDRIAALRGLERKYGEGEEEVLAFLERARRRLEELSEVDDRREHLRAEVERLAGEVDALAAALTDARYEGAPRLAEALRSELRELGMQDGDVEVRLEPAPLSSTGSERVEMQFSGAAGQPPLPLAKVASGGELSRTMLACRSVLVDIDDVPTLVFDEVDAGIGGRAAVAVGRRLARLAGRRQVIVVTHLPQIASFADRHARVEKHRGTASVQVLDDAGRVAELSRMLSGLPESEVAASHAQELLAQAARSRSAR